MSAPRYPTHPCRACGKPIVWALNLRTQKNVPLDPAAPVYGIAQGVDNTGKRTLLCETAKNYGMVSHFATCSAANRFSGSAGDRARREKLERVATLAKAIRCPPYRVVDKLHVLIKELDELLGDFQVEAL